LYAGGIFYEVKSILDEFGKESDEYEGWYLESSLLQCALYKSLLIEGNNERLYTPKFRLREGYKMRCVEVDINGPYQLIFGSKLKYEVEVLDSRSIIEYYESKVGACVDYDSATKWDAEHKFKDFSLLRDYFRWREI